MLGLRAEVATWAWVGYDRELEALRLAVAVMVN